MSPSMPHARIDSESYYRTLIAISPNAILVFDFDGNILETNTKANALFGIADRPSLIGQNIYDVIFSEDRDQALTNIGNVILHEELQGAEFRLQRQDGKVFWGVFSAKLIPSPFAFPTTIIAILWDITEKKIAEEKLRTLAVTDELTGLFNRRGYTIAAEQEIKHAFRRKEGLVLLFFDIDDFKMINSAFGHAEGDNALIKAAQVLRNSFRVSDIIARWGGDEFVVLALDVPTGSVHSLLKRLDKAMQQQDEKMAFSYTITFSRGIAHYDPAAPSSLAEMEKLADAMMYEEKNRKKSQ
ncbi:MAG: sensor domain-containing diguanylate cyclase [Candidatus Shapirobacteria bacterium]|jgi:diguanylate cyclase (GGDEF)-like protein/PAS domain S-box-containing protein